MLGTNSLQLVPAMRSMNLDNGDDDDDRCSACHGTGLRLRHRSRARGGASTTRRVQKTSPPQQSATASAVSQIPVPTGNKSCLNGQTTNVQKKAILTSQSLETASAPAHQKHTRLQKPPAAKANNDANLSRENGEVGSPSVPISKSSSQQQHRRIPSPRERKSQTKPEEVVKADMVDAATDMSHQHLTPGVSALRLDEKKAANEYDGREGELLLACVSIAKHQKQQQQRAFSSNLLVGSYGCQGQQLHVVPRQVSEVAQTKKAPASSVKGRRIVSEQHVPAGARQGCAIPGARSPVVGVEATDKAIAVAVDDGRDRSRGEKEPRDGRVRSSGTKRSELQSIEMDKKDRSKTRSKSRGRPLAVTSVQFTPDEATVVRGSKVQSFVWTNQKRIVYENASQRGREADVDWTFVDRSRSRDKRISRGERWLSIHDLPPSFNPPDPPACMDHHGHEHVNFSSMPAAARSANEPVNKTIAARKMTTSDDKRRVVVEAPTRSSNDRGDGGWYSSTAGLVNEVSRTAGGRGIVKSSEHVVERGKQADDFSRRRSALKSFHQLPLDGRHVGFK